MCQINYFSKPKIILAKIAIILYFINQNMILKYMLLIGFISHVRSIDKNSEKEAGDAVSKNDVLQDDVGGFNEKQHVTKGLINHEFLEKPQSINEVFDKPQTFLDKLLKPQDESSVIPTQLPNLQHIREEIIKRLKENEKENPKSDKQPWKSYEQHDQFLQRLYYDSAVHQEYEADEPENIEQQQQAL